MLFLFACLTSSKDSGETSSDLSTCSTTDLSNTATFDSSCQDFSGTATAGATGYFSGGFCFSGTSEGDQVVGTETWLLLANETWQELGEDDCKVVWNNIGVVRAPSGCPTCTIGVDLTASIDRSLTTCPPDLWAGEETLQESYDLFIGADGSILWYFSGSGNLFAAGNEEGNTMTYLSDPACLWF